MTATAQPLFLVVRHPSYQRHFYDLILRWVQLNFPELLRLFVLKDLPPRISDWTSIVLHIPWLQDPVQEWSTEAYEQANRVAQKCDEFGIPIINRVDRLTRAAKLEGTRLIASSGVRTPRSVLVEDIPEFRDSLLGMSLPLCFREDSGHGRPVFRADTIDEVRRLPLEKYTRPVCSELIDVRDLQDGLYRKYRYIAAGEFGVSHHVQVTKGWCTRGRQRVRSETTQNDELAYINKRDPNHEGFQRARRALQLDFVAFDYGYDHDGRVVVWEANPFPSLHFSEGELDYRNHAIHRTMAAMLGMYLRKASLPVPDRITEALAY